MSIETVRINELIEDENIFESKGIAKVKVTKGSEVKCLEIPIRSTGVSDLIDTFGAKAPQPPARSLLIQPGTPEGKELGITKKQWVKMPDYSDVDYIEEKNRHESDMGIAIVLKGLDVTFKTKDHVEITDPDKKVEALKKMGLSGDQFSQLVQEIIDLTRWSDEEMQGFFRVAIGLDRLDGKEPNFEMMTPFELEMKICVEYLDGKHSNFIKLSKLDKLKLFLYEEMQRRREKFFNDKMKLETHQPRNV